VSVAIKRAYFRGDEASTLPEGRALVSFVRFMGRHGGRPSTQDRHQCFGLHHLTNCALLFADL
jgi:hypothetical protein